MIGPRHACAVAMLALVAAVSGCGGSGAESEEEHEAGHDAAADVSTCRDEAEPAARPYGDGFPSSWPFPAQTVVFNAEDRGSDGTIVTAVSSTPFKSVLRFMNHQVVDAGFEVEGGETEEHDAEAEWRGGGFHGRWAIRESATCTGETVVQVLSARG